MSRRARVVTVVAIAPVAVAAGLVLGIRTKDPPVVTCSASRSACACPGQPQRTTRTDPPTRRTMRPPRAAAGPPTIGLTGTRHAGSSASCARSSLDRFRVDAGSTASRIASVPTTPPPTRTRTSPSIEAAGPASR